jgi:hypothetical protein
VQQFKEEKMYTLYFADEKLGYNPESITAVDFMKTMKKRGIAVEFVMVSEKGPRPLPQLYKGATLIGRLEEIIAHFKKIKPQSTIENSMKLTDAKPIAYVQLGRRDDLKKRFFDKENISLINAAISHAVKKDSNNKVKVSHQSENELLMYMKYTYEFYVGRLPDDTVSALLELNRLVVRDCVLHIYNQLRHRKDFLDWTFKGPNLDDLPKRG